MKHNPRSPYAAFAARAASAGCAAVTMLVASLLASASVHAEVTVSNVWVRATVPQQKATGAFMRLSSAKDSKLISVSSSLTPVVEVHEMSMQDNVMKMREVLPVELPAGKNVDFKPGGYHLMLQDLKQQVKVGDVVPLTLVFEGRDGKRETVQVKAEVRALNTSAQPAPVEHKH